MLICKQCERTFDEEEIATIKDDRGYCGDARAYEDVAVCPYCGADDIEEAVECVICKEYTDKDHTFKTDNGHICEYCLKAVNIKFYNIIKAEFTPEEIEALRALEEDEGLL